MHSLAVLVAIAGLAVAGPAADGLADYMLEENLELALARSAGPPSVADDATYLVLRSSGYETVHEGSNGFTCLVWRSWAGPAKNLDPSVRAPICMNDRAAATLLPVTQEIAAGVARGRSMEEVMREVNGRLDTKQVPLPAAGSLAYMLSSGQWLNQRVGSWRPHLMFYAPNVGGAEVGRNPMAGPYPFIVGDETGSMGNITVGLDDFVEPHRIDPTILDDPARTDRDREQDPYRRPLEVYEWLGVRPGQTVADVFAFGGYNTHLLARAVGPEGRVMAVVPAFAGRVNEILGIDLDAQREEKIARRRLTNVTTTNGLTELPDEQVDVVISVRNFHDIEFFGADSTVATGELWRAVKPGGVVGIVEVATDRSGWDEETHRLNESVVIERLEAAGFRLAGRSHLLANPADDHTTPGFQEGRETMDRYLLKFRKPGA